MTKPTATATATDEADARSLRSPALYLVLEHKRPLAGGARWNLGNVDEVRIGRGEERATRRDATGARTLAIEVPDPRMSTRHGRLARLATGWAFEDLGSKNGSRVGGAAVKTATLKDGDWVELGETLLHFREEGPDDFADLERPSAVAPGLATLQPSLARTYADLAAIATADVPVLLLGETGTGKEVAARAVHSLSGRKGRFVAVNCGALPRELIEAELFGHRQGAFSGATESRVGLVRSADRGTLFLDEVGDLPLASQAALLRVLQEREVTAVGETTPTKVDLRVVAATHRDLREQSERGEFRRDLLARIEGYATRLPPLRERACDLGDIIAALVLRISPERSAAITVQPAAARALAAYDFPGNVRELEQCLRASLALARDGVITLALLPERIRAPSSSRKTSEGNPSTTAKPLPQLTSEDAALKERLVALFTEHAGSINGVARAMQKDRTQIKRWIARLGIDPEAFR